MLARQHRISGVQFGHRRRLGCGRAVRAFRVSAVCFGVGLLCCIGCRTAASPATQAPIPATQSVRVAIGPSSNPEAVHPSDFPQSGSDSPAIVAPAPAGAVTPPANSAVRAAAAAAPPTGHACRVHFRRDAMGLSGGVPLGVGQGSIAGRAVEMSGTIEQVTEDWLVLRTGETRWWIPRSVILAIELTDER